MATQELKLREGVKGKVALVTRSSQAIGRECVRMLATAGASVAVTDVNDAEGQALVNEISKAGGTVGYWHLDLSKERQVLDVMRLVRARFGPITVLVNNVSDPVNQESSESASLDEELDAEPESRPSAPYWLKHVLPQMIEAGSGSIIEITPLDQSSDRSVKPFGGMAKGIRVNAIRHGVRQDDREAGTVPGQTVESGPKAEDIAFGALFLASDEARFVNGIEITIDKS